MARTIREIMAIARQSTKAPSWQDERLAEAHLFDRDFDEGEEVVDQYETIFDVNKTKSTNTGQAYIGSSRADWDDTQISEFIVSNESMDINKIVAMTDPDRARPTRSNQTLQSLSKLNVSKPIDLSRAMRLSAQSSMNYRAEVNIESIPEDSMLKQMFTKTALFGLRSAKKEVHKFNKPATKTKSKDH